MTSWGISTSSSVGIDHEVPVEDDQPMGLRRTVRQKLSNKMS